MNNNRVSEIVLRTYAKKFRDKYIFPITEAIRQNTDYKVCFTDHTNKNALKEELSHCSQKHTLSLDKYLAKTLNVDYWQQSRIFSLDGQVIGKFTSPIIQRKINSQTVVIDTDIVTGNTMKNALNVYETTNSLVLLSIQKHQDLIDLEDLLCNNSIFKDNDMFFKNNYMINELVFNKRTSLPIGLHSVIKGILKK